MFNYIFLIIIIVILILILIFTYLNYDKTKKFIILCDKDKDFIEFAIDMYIKYAPELNIHDEKKHEIIVGELEKIKEKIKK